MGVPICRRIYTPSSLDELYVDLHVLIVKQWTDLTAELLATTFERFFTIEVTDPDLQKKQALERLHLKEGDLIKGQNALVYLISNNAKCPINSLEIFTSYPGWDFGNVKSFTDFQISQIFDGPPVKKKVWN